MKVKLNKCIVCRKYPYVENYGKIIKIFCSHKYFEGINHKEVAGNWNIHNSENNEIKQ